MVDCTTRIHPTPRLMRFAVLGAILLACGPVTLAQENSPASHANGKNDCPEGLPAALALAEVRIAIKRTVVKIAEAQKKIVAANLPLVRAQLEPAQRGVANAKDDYRRVEELSRKGVVTAQEVRNRMANWEHAKLQLATAQRDIAQCELRLALCDARIERAQLEVREAELRLKQLVHRQQTMPD